MAEDDQADRGEKAMKPQTAHTDDRLIIANSPASSIPADTLDDASAEDYSKNFARWLKLQPVSTDVSLLYRLAADLASKGWGGVAFEVRRAADDLKTLTRHG